MIRARCRPRPLVLAAAVAGTVAALAAASVVLATESTPARTLASTVRPAAAASPAARVPAGGAAAGPSDPAAFAVVLESTRTGAAFVDLMSAATGRRRLVARVGTANGLALSPEGRSVFVVTPARGKIEIRVISAARRTVKFVADGAYPAVSPDGRYLAYATGRHLAELAVRNLRTGRTRVIDLAAMIGPRASFLNGGAVTWLGDGSQVAAMPEPDAVATASRQGPLVPGACGYRARASECLVLVHAGPGRLTARRLQVRTAITVLSGDTARRNLLIAAGDSPGRPGAIWAVRPGARRGQLRRIATLPAGAVPLAIAPAADRVTYLMSGRAPALWVARIGPGGLTAPRELYADTPRASVNGIAW